MEPSTTVHPADETLVSYGLGKLDETISDAVNRHLAQCPPCRERVAELSSDSFVDRLRDAQSPDAAPVASSSPTPPRDVSGDAPMSLQPSPPPAQVPPDLANHPQYEIVRELGRGGMGVVYLARNKLMNRLEVLKILNREVLARRGTVDRFLREIQSAGKLSHQNIVTAYSAQQIGELLVFAMEYVDGDDLSKLVKSRGPLPVVNACYFTMQVAQGLQHAHERGMIHRDIKPHNLMLSREGKRAVVKILDFGLAKITSEREVDGALTHEGQMLGTPDYIAPEQTLEAKKADIRADIYSLGCTLYYLLAGSPPFRGSSLYEILLAHQTREAKPLNLVRPEVPVELAAVIGKMMAKDPDRRFQTPAEVVQALKPFIKPKSKSSADKTGSHPDIELSQSGRIELPKSVGIQPASPVVSPDKASATPAQPTIARPAPATGGWDSSLDISELERSSPRLSALAKRSNKQLGRGKRLPGWVWPAIAAGGLCFALLVLWAGGFLSVATKDGVIVLEDLPPDASVFVDGQTINVQWKDDGTAQITVPPSKHGVEVKKDGFTTFGEEVTLSKGEKKLLTVKLEPISSQESAAKEPSQGFTPLFNGKDTTGWETHPSQAGKWRVEHGVLIGSGSAECPASQLYTKRDDFKDFHLLVEARLDGPEDSGLFFRSGFGPGSGVSWSDGYEAQMCHQSRGAKTGTLFVWPGGTLIAQRETTLGLAEWFTEEVIAQGNHLVVKVNGKVTAETDDARFQSGRIALQQNGAGMVVKFRKIEIKDLSPVESTDAATSKEVGPSTDAANKTAQESQPIPDDARRIWRGTYSKRQATTFERIGSKKWIETNNRDGSTVATFDEVGSTDEYVELLDKTRGSGISVRLRANEAQIINSGTWKWLETGAWDSSAAAKPPDKNQQMQIETAKDLDLLEMIDLDRHTVEGGWHKTNGSLFSESDKYALLQIPYRPSAEYELKLKAERISGQSDLQIGITAGKSRCNIVVDGWGGTISGISQIDGRFANANETKYQQGVFPANGTVLLSVVVRNDHITVKADDKQIIDWKGSYERLSTDVAKKLPPGLFLAVQKGATYRIDSIKLLELTPPDPAMKQDPLPVGSVWKGQRTYRKGAYQGGTVSYFLHVRERDGNNFKGHIFDNGPRRNRAEAEGEVTGDAITWRERPVFHPGSELRMTGTLKGPQIKLTFTGRYGNGATNEGDGELKLEGSPDQPPEGQAKTDAAPQNNGEQDDGSVSLFNGSDLTGWEGDTSIWKVEDGAIVEHRKSKLGGAKPLVCQGDYTDFELTLQYRLSNQGNSGVQFRSTRTADGGVQGYQADIGIAPGGNDITGNLYEARGRAMLRNVSDELRPQLQSKLRAGDWNDLLIRCVDDHVIVEINGLRTVDFSDPQGRRSGFFGFEGHGEITHIAFRSIRVRDLSRSTDAQSDAGSDAPEAHWKPLFNGKDLEGWTFPYGNQTSWAVVDGAIHGVGNTAGDRIATEGSNYEDFELQMEVRTSDEINKLFIFRSTDLPDTDRRYTFQGGGKRTDGTLIALGEYKVKTEGGPTNGRYATVDGLEELTHPASPPLSINQWHKVEIRAIDNSFRLVVDGKEVSAFRDRLSRLKKGRIEFALLKGASIDIRDIKIKVLSQQAELNSQPEAPESGWKPLFNGKDLTGWVDSMKNNSTWEVTNGVVEGHGPKRFGNRARLVTDRSNFGNFKLRLQVLRTGNKGKRLTIRQSTNGDAESGYAIYLGTGAEAGRPEVTTGIIGKIANYSSGAINWDIPALATKISANDWYTVEVAAIGNVITVSVNGRQVAEYADKENSFKSGAIAISCAFQATIKLKDMTIQELPLASSDATSIPAQRIGETGKDALTEAKSQFAEATKKADEQLILQFDTQADQLRAAKGDAGERVTLIEVLKSEKEAFKREQRYPFSQPMRAALITYMKSRQQAEKSLDLAFEKAIAAALERKNDEAAAALVADKKATLTLEVVGRFDCVFAGRRRARREIYSNGIMKDTVTPPPDLEGTWAIQGNLVVTQTSGWGDEWTFSPDGRTFKAETVKAPVGKKAGGKYTGRAVE